jgi:chromate reductase
MDILCICGSLRRDSYNAVVARTLPILAPAGMKITAAPSFRTIPHYDADSQQENGFPAEVVALGDAVRNADGVIVVTPEYNYSVPGALKNALDWVSRLPNQPFVHKPVAIQTAATGPVGGARAQYHLRQIMVFLEALVFNKPEIFINNVKTKIDERAGDLIDVPTREIIKQQLASFAAFVERLAPRN